MRTSILRLSSISLVTGMCVASAHAGSHGPGGGHVSGPGMWGTTANPTVVADRAAVKSDVSQLRSDQKAGNASAVAADRTQLQTDTARLQTDLKSRARARQYCGICRA